MIIKRITLTNFGPFAGVQELELGAGVHAVVARLEGAEGRSNWLGKSTFLEAVPFALYGQHRERTEDEWIFEGAKSGGVLIAFDDGTTISRGRIRGKSTQVTIETVRAGAAASDEAERAIARCVGLSYADFRATAYVAQKKMARLVSLETEASERMKIVAGWFRLEPLAVAASSAASDYASALDAVRSFERTANNQEADAVSMLASVFGLDRSAIANAEEAMAERIAQQAAAADRAEAELEAFKAPAPVSELAALERDAAAFADAVTKGRALKSELDREFANVDVKSLEEIEEQLPGFREGATQAQAAFREKERVATEKRSLARGEFSGTCPVAGIECPAAAQIRGRTAENAAASRAADADMERLRPAWDAAVTSLTFIERSRDRVAKLSSSIEVQREIALRTKPAAQRAKALRDAGGNEPAATAEAGQSRAVAMADLATRARALRQQVGMLEGTRGRIQEGLAGARKAREDAEAQRPRLEALKAAVAILGRNGAQRVVAEDGLGVIESGANNLLGGLGIDLAVKLAWSREGSGLAAACEDCGMAFPASKAKKQCDRCGAARGPNVINRLEPELSDRSGAAEDLAGAAVQLAASAWLREERGTPWEVALLDEPFGALDAANRRAFAGHLATMLRGGAFRQAFVVAHHPEVMDALPLRVQIVSDGKKSRLVAG